MASTAVPFRPFCRQRPIPTRQLVPGSSSLWALDFLLWNRSKRSLLYEKCFLFCGTKTRLGGCTLFSPRNKVVFRLNVSFSFLGTCWRVPGILLALTQFDRSKSIIDAVLGESVAVSKGKQRVERTHLDGSPEVLIRTGSQTGVTCASECF